MATPLPKTRTFITSLISSLPNPTSSNSNEEPSRNPLKALTGNQRAILMTLHVLFPNELLPALDLLDRDLVTRYTIQASALATTKPEASADGVTKSTEESKTETAFDETAPANQSGDRSTTTAAAAMITTPIYYVRSAQSTSNNSNSRRYRDPVASSTHYEVRPLAWSCSCPAFTFAAFPFHSTSSHQSSHQRSHQSAHQSSHQQPHQSHPSHHNPPQQSSTSDFHTRAGPDAETQSWSAGGLSNGQEVPICKHLLACTLVEQTGVFGAFVREREVIFEEMVGWAAGWGG